MSDHVEQFKQVASKIEDAGDEKLKEKFHDLDDEIMDDGKYNPKDLLIHAVIALELKDRGYDINYKRNAVWFTD